MAATEPSTTTDPPAELPAELGVALFDQESRRVTGISGDEFSARWDSGEFRDIEDKPEGRELAYLILLIPFGRLFA
jgi:hypothetical protein